MTDNQKRVLDLKRRNPDMSQREIAKRTGLGKSSVGETIKKYYREGINTGINIVPSKSFTVREACFGDLHSIYMNEEVFWSTIYSLGDIQYLTLLGDVMDFYKLSRFETNPKERDTAYEVDWGKNLFRKLRKEFPNTKITWVAGNHDLRFEKYIMQNASQLIGIKGMDLPTVMELDKQGIDYVDNWQRRSKGQDWFKIGKLNHIHGHEIKPAGESVYPARRKLMNALDNVIFGHHHKTDYSQMRKMDGDTIGAWSVGCMCDINPEYNPHNNWSTGMAEVLYRDDGNFVVQNKTWLHGAWY